MGKSDLKSARVNPPLNLICNEKSLHRRRTAHKGDMTLGARTALVLKTGLSLPALWALSVKDVSSV